ncbi:MAG: aminotransferase class I/II-fold pyridoxal phosphate-dependent enzyme [Nitrospirota bacterium]
MAISDPRQGRTPLFDAMVELAQSRKVSFHTPGHKSGKGISTRFRKFVGPKIFSIDLTTLDEVDSLQKPVGVIKEAQELAALAYGADASFFLLNGTTGGNHAMVVSSTRPGEKILVARNCHKSVIVGTILAGAHPIFIPVEYDAERRLARNVRAADIEKALQSEPDARTLLVTSPNYYGYAVDLGAVAALRDSREFTLLVDEAHGPHLKFHADLPLDALTAGADMCVQSTHKIIGGMTQASILHARGGRVDLSRVSASLKSLQTTSPSYILMASLDLARMQMATEGEKLLTRVIELAEEARAKINRIPGLVCRTREEARLEGLGDVDVTKLAISVVGTGRTGHQVSQELNHRFGIQVEMADPAHVLVIVSIGDRKDDLHRLVNALEEIARDAQAGGKPRAPLVSAAPPRIDNPLAILPRDAFFAPSRFVPLEEAVGKVSADIVTVYPPGIPVLIPGETIAREVAEYIQAMARHGSIMDGLDETNTQIKIVA